MLWAYVCNSLTFKVRITCSCWIWPTKLLYRHIPGGLTALWQTCCDFGTAKINSLGKYRKKKSYIFVLPGCSICSILVFAKNTVRNSTSRAKIVKYPYRFFRIDTATIQTKTFTSNLTVSLIDGARNRHGKIKFYVHPNGSNDGGKRNVLRKTSFFYLSEYSNRVYVLTYCDYSQYYFSKNSHYIVVHYCLW